MSSTFRIFQTYYEDLVQSLPMSDSIFIAKLFKNGLLPNNCKAELKCLSTSADKAARFLDNVIEPAIKVDNDSGETNAQFILLLSVMKESGYDNVKMLAETVTSELNQSSLSCGRATDDAVQWFNEFLKKRYIDMDRGRCDEGSDPWPPFRINCFTTPVFIHKSLMQTRMETESATSARVFGDIEDIPEVTKSPRLKSIEEIFELTDSYHPNKILIEGHPGIGKTTLTKEICVRWAKGELLCSDKFVFLLFLRDPFVLKITNEQQLIKYFTSNSKVNLIQYYLEEKRGADVTFIIDGFDELNVELRCNSLFTRLIQGKLLDKARVVVTSRPLASSGLHRAVDRRVEILGFERSDRERIINEALKNNPEKLKSLHRHFQHHPDVDAVCYIPLVLNIMIFMCELGYLPPTITEMYTNFILHTICRHLKRKGQMGDDDWVTKMEEFPEPVCGVLNMLQKVAFDGIINDRIVFEEKDLPDHEMCKNDPTCFGLLQSTKCYSPTVVGAPVLTFNFYHLQLQEYFAAKHIIMSLPEGEAYDLVRKHFFVKDNKWDSDNTFSSDEGGSDDEGSSGNEDVNSSDDTQSDYSSNDEHHPDDLTIRLSYVWIFMFGLTKGDFVPLQHYLSTYSDSDDEEEENERSQNDNIPPSRKQCIIPSAPIFFNPNIQISRIVRTQNKVSQDILLDDAKVLYLFQCFQEAQDSQFCRGLAQMISRCSIIDLENQVLHPHHIASLGLFLSSSKHKWTLLDLTSCHLEDEGFDELHHHLCVDTNKSSIEMLCINNNDLTEASLSLLTDFISKFQLSGLNLSDNRICFAGLKGIFSTKSKVSTVKDLRVEMIGIKMSDTTITVLDREVICNMMSSLTSLFIGRNGLYDEGAELLSEGLVNTPSLKILSVWNGNIFSKGAIALADALSKNTSLEQLDLRWNGIGDDGAVAFVNVLMNNNRTLIVLGMEHNDIGPTGTDALKNLATSKPSLSLF